MTEHQAIEQLSQYKEKLARLKVLSSYSVGAGITISRLHEDDQLQELHSKLRGMPSYMYLSKREQQLESLAHAYLERYPAGVKSQLSAIPKQGADEEDSRLLQELRKKISKVVAARGWDIRDDIDEVLNRLSELQDLQAEVNRIDTVINALEQYKPKYAKVLREHVIENKSAEIVAESLGVSRKSINRWKTHALAEYIKLIS